MINQEQFELHQHIVDWLMEGGITMREALCVVNFADEMNQSIPSSYVNLAPEYIVASGTLIDGEEKKNP
jgi:hypothetical protein